MSRSKASKKGSKRRKSKTKTTKHRRKVRVVRKKISTREKGSLFEDVVAEYFKLIGYSVKRNVVLIGFSGARHEIDVLIKDKDGTIGVVEVKNYSKPIPKEWIMKAYNVGKDVGASEVYVVSASGFSPGAIKTAKVLNVKLLNLDDLSKEVQLRRETSEIPTYYIKPLYSFNDALEVAKKFAIKRFFKSIEIPTKTELIYIPLYLVKGLATFYEEEGFIFKKIVKRKREVMIPYDASRNSLPILHPDDKILELLGIKGLNESERELLKVLLKEQGMTKKELIKQMKWSRQKLSRILNSLIKKGLVYQIKDEENEEITYYTRLPSFEKLRTIIKMLPVFHEGEPKQDINTKIVKAAASVSNVVSLITDLYDIESPTVKLLYIPLYKIRLDKKDSKSFRYIFVSAWTPKDEVYNIKGID